MHYGHGEILCGEVDYTAVENMWYYYALTSVYKMAETLGYEEDICNAFSCVNAAFSDCLRRQRPRRSPQG